MHTANSVKRLCLIMSLLTFSRGFNLRPEASVGNFRIHESHPVVVVEARRATVDVMLQP